MFEDILLAFLKRSFQQSQWLQGTVIVEFTDLLVYGGYAEKTSDPSLLACLVPKLTVEFLLLPS